MGNMQKVHIATATKPVTFYSLDMVISVGYRVSSAQATLFRRWATDKLVQFAQKGFVIDSVRLKQPETADRIAELRDIRADDSGDLVGLSRTESRASSLRRLESHRRRISRRLRRRREIMDRRPKSQALPSPLLRTYPNDNRLFGLCCLEAPHDNPDPIQATPEIEKQIWA